MPGKLPGSIKFLTTKLFDYENWNKIESPKRSENQFYWWDGLSLRLGNKYAAYFGNDGKDLSVYLIYTNFTKFLSKYLII